MDLAEIRFYTGGWIVRVGLLAIRWNRQDNYCGVSLEKITRDFLFSGGMSWREFRTARRQSRAAKEAARRAATLDPLPAVPDVCEICDTPEQCRSGECPCNLAGESLAGPMCGRSRV